MSTSSFTSPRLPPLFFLSIEEAYSDEFLIATSKNSCSDTSNNSNESPSFASLHVLPAEMLQQCLTAYADWGDLAKIATIKRSWSHLLRAAADHGGHDSKWALACALLDGTNGLVPNPRLAIEYLTELTGVTLGQDEDENNSSTESRIECFAPAARKLATCYLNGYGVEQNNDVGLQWLKAAYTAGSDLDAAHELGNIYEYGHHDVGIDVVSAAEWFLKSAEGGHVDGMAEYGLCCELGCGREQSDEEAMEWYTKAAEAGHVTAKYSVGEAFEEARGVPQSDSEACIWYYKAAVDGDEDSKRALIRLRDIARIVLPGWEGTLNV